LILETPATDTALAAADWCWADEADCARWATTLAGLAETRQAFITLQGPLGAGKTTLVRHLLRALGVAGRIKSPTYTVMEPYTLPDGGEAAHFDFYRFSDPREWLDAGFRDVFSQPGLKLAEWPEQAAGLLPTPDLRLTLVPLDEHQRQVQALAGTALGQRLIGALALAQPCPATAAIPPAPPDTPQPAA
jgi:tRNA threonylcarbamoyladenosine biosynthesis protein TsaE